MVATNKGNLKPKPGGNGKKLRSAGPMNGINKRYNGRAGMNAMFNPSQIPDNPGYLDFNLNFNEPPVASRPPAPSKLGAKGPNAQKNNGRRRVPVQNIGGGMVRNKQRNQNGWAPRIPNVMANSQRPLPPPGNGRNFRNGPMRHGGAMGRPLPPPMRPPMPPPPPRCFGPPRPLIPPMGPMGGPMCPPGPPMRVPPRPMMTRSGGAVGPMPPVGGGPIRRGKNIIAGNRKNLKNRKLRPGSVQGVGGHPTKATPKKSVGSKKTLKEIVSQYPLDKPWVNEEIRGEHKKKEDIENKLKGNKDDKLFAEFKIQRDKFVTMYEAARLEFIGKHPEKDINKIMTESDKEKGDRNTKPKPNDNRKTNDKSAAT